MSEKTTYYDLLDRITERSDLTRENLEEFMREFTRIVEEGLKTDGEVRIAGFGKIELRWMQERSGINPQTGDEITIPGQNKVTFKPYKSLRDQVNRPYAQMKAEVLDQEQPSETGNHQPNRKRGASASGKRTANSSDPRNGHLKIDEVQILVADKDGPLVIERPSPLRNES